MSKYKRQIGFDLEGNGLLEDLHTIHCAAAYCKETGERWFFGPGEVESGLLPLLDSADCIYAHNALGYDIEALWIVFKWRPKCAVRDTLVKARFLFSDMMERDTKDYEFDGGDENDDAEHKQGHHSLEAWGKRLGVHKGEFDGPWDVYTEEMGEYCRGDVEVLEAIDVHLDKTECPERPFQDEQRFVVYTGQGCRKGFPLDVEEAKKFAVVLEKDLEEQIQAIAKVIPPTKEYGKLPTNWTYKHLVTGEEFQRPTKGECEAERKLRKWKPKEVLATPGPVKETTVYFNPGSHKQVLEYFLSTYGYLSPYLTDTGQKLYDDKQGTYNDLAKQYGAFPEELLRNLQWPEAKHIADYKLILKRLGAVSTGKNAWLKLERNGRIHHNLIHIGAVTHRTAHSKPNLGQVPSVEVDKETKHPVPGLAGRYGKECRSLFYAPDGYKLVGCDMSGIEARMLAHFLFPYDKGAYIDTVLNGDIHQANADAFLKLAGFKISRKDVKTPFYAWCYSAGKEKMGKTVSELSDEANAEFLEWQKFMRSENRDAMRVQRMAAIIATGTERRPPAHEAAHQEFVKRIKWINRIRHDNVQDTTKLAMMAVGGKVDMAFKKGIVGMDLLLAEMQKEAEKGYIVGLDGRRLPVRKTHAALNTKLQGNAAIAAKKWTNYTFDEARKRKVDAWCAAFVHDEIQSIVEESRAEEHRDYCIDSIRRAGVYYKLHIRLDGDGRIGRNWCETH